MKKYFAFLFLGVTVNVFAQLNFTVNPAACKNDSTNLVANSGTISSPGFSWSAIPIGINFSTPTSSTTNAIFTSSGNYTIFLTAISGTTTYSFQNQITINPTPTITLAQNTLTTCIIYNPNYTNPVILNASGGQSYTWTPLPVTIGSNPNGPTMTYRPPSTSCFTVVGSNSFGCKAFATACATVLPTYSINITPSNTVMCAAILGVYSSVTLVVQPITNTTAVAPYKCEWSFTSSTNSIEPVIPNWVGPQTYTVEMVDSRGCRSLPATFTITTTDCTSLNELSEITVKFYPNPTNGKLIMNSLNPTESIEISNSVGQLVFKLDKPESEQEFNISHLPNGIYFVKAKNVQGQSVFKVVKE